MFGEEPEENDSVIKFIEKSAEINLTIEENIATEDEIQEKIEQMVTDFPTVARKDGR